MQWLSENYEIIMGFSHFIFIFEECTKNPFCCRSHDAMHKYILMSPFIMRHCKQLTLSCILSASLTTHYIAKYS